MFVTVLLCQLILTADFDEPVSAVDAVAIGHLPDYFCEPDSNTAALFAMPVARVNDVTITAEEVLAQWVGVLLRERETKSSAEYAKLVHQLIKITLPHHVKQVAVWTAAKRDLDSEQMDLLLKEMENSWETIQVPRLVSQLAERQIIGSQPYPVRLEVIKQKYIQDGIVGAYLQSKVSQKPPVWDDQRKSWKQNSEYIKNFVEKATNEANITTVYSLSLRR